MTSDIEQYYDDFFAFERRDHVWDVEIDGVCVWRWIRKNVNNRLLEGQFDRESPGNHGSVPTRTLICAGLGWLRSLLFHNPFFVGDSDVVFLGRERRMRLQDGYWWDIHTDPIHQRFDHPSTHLELPLSHHGTRHRRPAKTPRVHYLETIEYAGTLQRRLGVNEFELSADEKSRLTEIEDELRSWFGVDVDVVSRVERQLNVRKTTKWLYRRLLQRLDPTLAIIVRGPAEEVFVETCKELDITTVGIQHGIIDKYHIGYSFPGGLDKHEFPDHFLFWGEYWKDAVDLPIPDSKTYCVGFPFIEQQSSALVTPPTREKVLFLPSPQYGTELAQLAIAVSEMIDTTIEVVFKVHPSKVDEWERHYPFLQDSPVTVADGSEKSLYQHQSEAWAQVGVKSTAIYEGLYFGLETYLYDLGEVFRLRPLVDEGYATLVRTPSALAERLQEDRGGPTDYDTKYFFRGDANRRVPATLEELADQSD